MIISVAIPSPLRRLFDYLPPQNPSQPSLVVGLRVSVPFGSRQLVGLIVAIKKTSDQPENKLKAITDVIDAEPLINRKLLSLFQWAADYYQHPVGDALLSTLPSLLRKGQPLPSSLEDFWQLSSQGLGLDTHALKRAKKQQHLLQVLQKQGRLTRQQLKQQGVNASELKALVNKALVEKIQEEPTTPATPDSYLGEEPLSLRDEQQRVMASLEYQQFNCYLLFGDTGTGKTEIYLQAIDNVLQQGRQALVLVPEINLTPQTLKRFQHRFTCPIASMHSALTPKQRLQSWSDARSGKARIIIGTRSAIFAPVAKLGIIILDEEHDSSFKQQDGFRYSARDIAVMRANRENIPVLLGSATPSLESLHNCQRGRYTCLHLTERSQLAPRWQLLDLKGTQLKAGIAAPLIDAIDAEISKGNQALIFLNRRGYSPLLQCHDCGWQAECRHCAATLTAHLRRQKLICHHCEWRQPIPSQCPGCHSPNIQFSGQGTERSEELLKELFPNITVMRIDRDSTSTKDAMATAIEHINRNEPCILIGTQMLAKGHHFPSVTLAALLEVDSGLVGADFRSSERLAQLITQVAGRAGRGDKPGRVIIQSHYVEHPLLQEMAKADYRRLSTLLLHERQLQHLPPYSHLSMIRAEATLATSAEAFLRKARELGQQLLAPSPTVRYLGPIPSPLERRKGFHRFALTIFSDNRSQLGQAMHSLCLLLEKEKTSHSLRWSVDIDPQDNS